MRSAASLVTRRAIAGSTSPAPAVQVSRAWASTLSPGASAPQCRLELLAALAALAAGQNGDLARGELQRGNKPPDLRRLSAHRRR